MSRDRNNLKYDLSEVIPPNNWGRFILHVILTSIKDRLTVPIISNVSYVTPAFPLVTIICQRNTYSNMRKFIYPTNILIYPKT